MRELFVRGGPIMWPLLLLSVISLTISIERALFWWRARKNRDDGVVEDIFRLTEKGDFEAAVSAGRKSPDIVAEVLVSGLEHRDYGLAETMQVTAEDEIVRMKRGLDVLDTIITMAPLLGILGTVLGIIESFDLLGASGIEDPKAVTGGIAQALLTTAAGLSVALLTLVPFNYLAARVQRATKHLESLTTRFEVAYRKGLERKDASQ
jgi:biopolymer transport protein ExbB